MSKQYTNQLESEIENLNLRIEELEDDKLQLRRENAKLSEQIHDMQNVIPESKKQEDITNLYAPKEDPQYFLN